MKIKNYLLMVFSLMSVISFSQIPTGYYDGTSGLSGAALKTKLSTIVTNGHTDKGYAGLWTAYKTTDLDQSFENDGSILDIYSENPNGTDPYVYQITTNQCGTYYAEGDCYNREHIVPQSMFGSAAPMANDVHFVRAVDGYVNGMRSNNPYGKVGTTINYTAANGAKLGTSITPGFSGKVFEPLDPFKGDIARMIFYFATRYESKLTSFVVGEFFDGTTYPGITSWELNLLLEWHYADPVSQQEINRNNASYTYQGNRNPFIDHPEYVQLIWGGGSSTDVTAPSTPTNIIASNVTNTSATISWTASTDNVAVASYNIYKDGVLAGNSTTNSFNATGLTQNTTYSITVEALDAAGNKSAISSALAFTTTNPDTAAPSVPSGLVASSITTTSATVSWTASTDNTGVTGYKIFRNGTQVGTSTSTSYNFTDLTAGTSYSITVQAYDAAGNSSSSSTALSFTTTNSTAKTELYFSEYLEGSSYNKAIEISNRTTATINLSAYSIKIAVNGSTTWTNVATLSGTLAANKAYVLANSSYALKCSGKINLKTGSLDFNGNDAVGLFKNDVLIDIIGNLGNSSNFAADVTLRRNTSYPKTTYNASEWTSYASDTCSNLATVNPTGTARMSANKTDIAIYPNPARNQEIYFSGTDLQNIEKVSIYSAVGTLVQSIENPFEFGNKINLKNLPKGVYWVIHDNQSEKLIIE